MADASESEHYTLVVRGPVRDRLYDHFSELFYGRNDVEVVKDRRVAERRRAAVPSTDEHRRAERRDPDAVWVVPPD